MAELADAHGSGPCDSNIMRVQVPSSARKTQVERLESFCVIEKIAIDVGSLVIEVMVLELSN